MATLADVISQLESIGVYTYVLPFLVTFAIVFGVLQKMQLFGDETDRIDAIIGLVAGFFVANFAFTTGVPVGVFLSNFFGAFAVVLVFLLGALLAAGIAGHQGEEGWVSDNLQQALMVIGGLALISIFVAWGGLQVIVPDSVPVDQLFLSSTNMVTLLVVLGAIGLVWLIMRGGGD